MLSYPCLENQLTLTRLALLQNQRAISQLFPLYRVGSKLLKIWLNYVDYQYCLQLLLIVCDVARNQSHVVGFELANLLYKSQGQLCSVRYWLVAIYSRGGREKNLRVNQRVHQYVALLCVRGVRKIFCERAAGEFRKDLLRPSLASSRV